MRLLLLAALTMVAFAANSVLNRLALAPGDYDAMAFGAVRLVAGAVTLATLVALRGGAVATLTRPAPLPTAALALYIFGFSWAYLVLDAGLGALILFGVVQLTMFAGAIGGGERPSFNRWTGAALAMGGLAWLLWPTQDFALSLPHAAAMAAAGLGWGLYSLAGRGARDPMGDTARNFLWAAPIGVLLALLTAQSGALVTTEGFALAVLSGAVTSGLGYALWYRVLPQIPGSLAAMAQLTVPAIAMGGGMLVLSEPLTLRFVLASILILGGIALGLRR